MATNIKFRNTRSILAALALGIMLMPGCGKAENINLNTSLHALSSAEDQEEGQAILVDDYIEQELDGKDTSIKELERELEDAYLDEDKDTCNEKIAEILKAEIKAMTAEGLGIELDEIENFQITGYYVETDLLDFASKDGSVDEYAIYFEYNGTPFELKAEGKARNACFCYRAAANNELDLYGDTNTIKGALNLAEELLEYDFYWEDKPSSAKLVSGKMGGLSEHINFNGNFGYKHSKNKTRFLKRRGRK